MLELHAFKIRKSPCRTMFESSFDQFLVTILYGSKAHTAPSPDLNTFLVPLKMCFVYYTTPMESERSENYKHYNHLLHVSVLYIQDTTATDVCNQEIQCGCTMYEL